MKKRGRAVMAGIIAAALAAGLTAVYFGVKAAREEQAEWLENLYAEGSDTEAGIDDGSDTGAGSDSLSEDGNGSGSGAVNENENISGAGGQDGGSDASGDTGNGSGQEGSKPDQSGSGSEESTDGGGPTAVQPPVPIEQPLTQPDFGTPPVMNVKGKMTDQALMAWMMNESIGAAEARNLMEKEKALASGNGTEGDPERRAFAGQQFESNYQARINLLEEKGSKLVLDYFMTAALVKTEEYQIERLEALMEITDKKIEEADSAAAVTDDEKKSKDALLMRLDEDKKRVTEQIEESAAALEKAKADFTAACERINTATGNEAGTAVELSGELKLADAPAMSADEAVKLGLQNRNEIKSSLQDIIRAQKLLTDMKFKYAPDSAEIIGQQNELARAQAAYPERLSEIESDIRGRHGRLLLERSELEKLMDAETDPLPEYELKSREEEVKEKTEDGKEKVDKKIIWESNLDDILLAFQKIYGRDTKLAVGLAGYSQTLLEFEHAAGAGISPAVI